jgi:hypothetical protein
MTELPHALTVPPALETSRPRDVALTTGGRTLVVLAVLLFMAASGVGVGMYNVARRQADDRRAIVEEGVTTTGVVTRLRSDGDDRRRVGYEFAVNGRVVRGERQVSAERRKTLQVGSPIDVQYLPSDPTVNNLGGRPRSGIPIALPFVLAPAIAALGVVCLVQVHRQRRLLSEGRVASAMVTGHAKHNSSHGGTHRAITFTFPLLSGATASGKSGASSKPPALGSVITVVYDPDQPGRNAVYPFSLVKPAR